MEALIHIKTITIHPNDDPSDFFIHTGLQAIMISWWLRETKFEGRQNKLYWDWHGETVKWNV